MLVSDVESITGLSKKSIRYYEEVGLVHPTRNTENDYRIYSLEDIEKLKRIKFLRELNVSIHDMQLLDSGNLTLIDCMYDRIKKIEAEEEKFKKIRNMCVEISRSNDTFSTIEIEKYFRQMNILNKEGFTMRSVCIDHSKKIRGAVLSSLFFSIFFVFMIFMIFMISYFQFKYSQKISWFIYFILIFLFLFPVISIVYNLIVRIREIKGGEEDEASKY